MIRDGHEDRTEQVGGWMHQRDCAQDTPEIWAAESIRIILDSRRGEESFAILCRREGIAESLYYNWWKPSWR